MFSEKVVVNADTDGKTPSAEKRKHLRKKKIKRKRKKYWPLFFLIAFSPWLSCPKRKNNTIMVSIYCLFFQDILR